MQCTRPLLAGGFLKRSYNEAKRLGHIAVTFEAATVPMRPRPLVYFDTPQALTDCKTMCDSEIGGYSNVDFKFIPGSASEPAHARFRGHISTELPKENLSVINSGYAGWRTTDPKWNMFNSGIYDIDPYRYIALRVKSDGGHYFVNIQTESIVPTDLHQHRLYARRPGQWETILIRTGEFVRTNHGAIMEPQSEMMKDRVRSIGISSIKVPGPFELCISRVWATNIADRNATGDEEMDAMRRRQKQQRQPPQDPSSKPIRLRT
ncbi:CIA30-domain-containing protein [Eremomyces bilateralis CBS 781.70]|uniref:CIA30-domain-containing protein n=1 Tax=Eremomyces bilateralis CBS 781.70 TaxID=1392243 RepID=A0A6G1FZ02_9PEZI|nr:CIA30-domain-containing protein [Eremomyces bilateralis CBS 781.70]KAF1811077.1 CIA30-domain-containing protein [Eremomyces bilateralis CBS 781.70]